MNSVGRFQPFSWDFPYGFLPTTRVDLFCDSLSVPPVCKSFFQSVLRFFSGKWEVRRDLRLPTRSSTPCEDTSSVVAGVLTCSVFILTSRLPISAAQSLPEWSGTTRAEPPPPPSGRLSSGNGAQPSP